MNALGAALRRRLVATLAAGAIAVTVAACGDDDVDELREQVESSAEELRNEGDALRKDIEEGANSEELRNRVDEFEEKARTEGDALQREAEELQRELEERTP
jgi:hypothetical protein